MSENTDLHASSLLLGRIKVDTQSIQAKIDELALLNDDLESIRINVEKMESYQELIDFEEALFKQMTDMYNKLSALFEKILALKTKRDELGIK